MRHFADTFTPAPEAHELQLSLIRTCDAFAHLTRARLACLFSERVILDRGVLVPALTVVPAQISSKQIERVFHEWSMANLLRESLGGNLPDFVTYLDYALWTGATTLDRERVLFHELRHLRQRTDDYDCPMFDKDGRPALRLHAHDAEVFYDELERYGRLVPSFDNTALAIAKATHAHRPRKVS